MSNLRDQGSNEDEIVFERVFRAHYADVHAYARRRTSRDAALDVVADTFLVAWRRIDDVPEQALPWLLGVARRSLANQIRAERRHQAVRSKARLLDEGAETVVEPSPDPELLSALAGLPDAEREAILLVAWDGLTPGQAAASLGCSGVAFRVRLHRARRHLSRALSLDRSSGSLKSQAARPREEPS